MRRFITSVAALVVGLAVVGPSQAGPGGSGSSSRGYSPAGPGYAGTLDSRYVHSDVRSHHEPRNEYRGPSYHGSDSHFWTRRYWDERRGGWLYWCPERSCWFYWHERSGGYFPIDYYPPGFYQRHVR